MPPSLETPVIPPKNARKTAIFLALSASFLFGAVQAQAHALLVASEPAAKSKGAAPQTIQLHFSEDIATKFSTIKLTDIDGKVVATTPVATTDPKLLVAKPVAPLAPGLYTVSYVNVATDDGHKMTGSFSFTVK